MVTNAVEGSVPFLTTPPEAGVYHFHSTQTFTPSSLLSCGKKRQNSVFIFVLYIFQFIIQFFPKFRIGEEQRLMRDVCSFI